MASVLEYIDDYRTGYHYQLGGNGAGGGIDCSHLVYAILKKAGYDFAYSPVATMEASGNFLRIAVRDAKPGDLAIYINHHGGTSDHVGIIISINEQSNGIYFGSQSSTGPANTQFGPDARYWKAPNYILRPKEAKTPATTPAPPPPKIQQLKWAYPVQLKSGSTKFEPAMYFKGLSKALGGSYPVGGTGLLHPGIHIDLGTASFIDHKVVSAIADGQVVAYRMDPEPLSIHYQGATDAAKYSSSFVLIKHKLQLPPKPPAPAATPASEPESIILYSLYMHLADAKSYANEVQKLEKPPYLPLKFKVKNNLTKPIIGLRVRDKPGGNVLGIVPLLGKTQTGASHPSNPKWKKFNGVTGASLAQVNVLPVGKTPTTDGYIFTGTLNSEGIVVSDTDSEPTRISAKVTHVYNQVKTAGRKVIANLPAGAILELGAKSKIDGSFYELRSAENLQNYPAPKDSAGKIIGWVDKDDLEEQPLTPPAGVQILNPPVEVKAGQLIGHPGVFQNHNNGSAQVQLHIELFTPDDLPAFIEKGRAWAQDPNIKPGDKTLLKVSKGAELIALVKDGEQKIQPPKSTDPKAAIHSELILPLSALNALPADHKQSLPESSAANAKKLQWWLLENVGGQADGTAITGWLCENQVKRVSPWEWPGFVTLEDDTPDEKLIAYQLKIANKLRGDELSTYSNIETEAQQWPVTKHLLKTIKENVVEDVDVNNSLTSAELTKAYKGYWCAQKISSIAVKTKTEWKKDPARWNALDKIMGHKEDAPNENWLTEKAKIEKLSFWDDVSSVTGNSDGKVWFLNPIELPSKFLKNADCATPLTISMLKKIADGITDANVNLYLNDLNALLPQRNINNCLRKGHFISQVIHESGSFRYTKELGETLSYDPWRGRGLIQVTFESNYRSYGRYANEDVYSTAANMSKLERLPHSLLSAIWFWSEVKNLNVYADNDDFIAITIAINGGLNGYDHRLKVLNAYVAEMDAKACFVKNIDGIYRFEDSLAYDSRRSSFAWGLWNDPGIDKKGKSKSKDEAIKGYKRFIALHEDAGEPPMRRGEKWYGYADPVSLARRKILEL